MTPRRYRRSKVSSAEFILRRDWSIRLSFPNLGFHERLGLLQLRRLPDARVATENKAWLRKELVQRAEVRVVEARERILRVSEEAACTNVDGVSDPTPKAFPGHVRFAPSRSHRLDILRSAVTGRAFSGHSPDEVWTAKEHMFEPPGRRLPLGHERDTVPSCEPNSLP